MRTFDSPVYVKNGELVVEEIACLEDALEFLYDWPEARRGAIHQTALRACQSVIERNYPLKAARDAFAGLRGPPACWRAFRVLHRGRYQQQKPVVRQTGDEPQGAWSYETERYSRL